MRKYPPAPVFLRKCTKTYQVPETDIIIEEGLSVLIPAYGLHRDPEYFPEPEVFDPERFNEENKRNIQEYTYIPFGDGPRVCIGEFKIGAKRSVWDVFIRNSCCSLK